MVDGVPDLSFGDAAFGGGYNLGVDTAFQPIDIPALNIPTGFDPMANLNIGKEALAGAGRQFPPDRSTGFADVANVAKSALPWLQLGTTALGAVSGVQAASAAGHQAKTAERAQKVQAESARQAQQTAQPAAAFGAEELARAGRGEVPGPIQAQIDEWAQAAKQKAMDYAARSGQGDSTMLTTWLSWIDKQAQSMKAAALEQEQQLGLQGIQTAEAGFAGAAGAAGGAERSATGEVNALDSLIASANKQLAALSAGAA